MYNTVLCTKPDEIYRSIAILIQYFNLFRPYHGCFNPSYFSFSCVDRMVFKRFPRINSSKYLTVMAKMDSGQDEIFQPTSFFLFHQLHRLLVLLYLFESFVFQFSIIAPYIGDKKCLTGQQTANRPNNRAQPPHPTEQTAACLEGHSPSRPQDRPSNQLHPRHSIFRSGR